ncbi:MAG: ChuX/HutX family heme-like substrate-binding protein [Rickettsiales bacterium]|nr:ChuX/HutX family heme-like substrate-binding protein [Rickettsiales bacterium]
MNTNLAVKIEENNILERFNNLKNANPAIRPKDAAIELGISEEELVAARIDGKTIFRLENKPEEILLEIHKFGEVTALTRNESVVHERKGVYNNVSFFTEGPMRMGLVVNADIDLRLFMAHWASAYAVEEQTKAGPKKSIQFYGKDGLAIHKIYLTSKSDENAYNEVVNKYRSQNQATEISVTPLEPKRPDLPDSEVDYKGFEAELRNLKDTHDFYILLRKYKIGRVQALRLVSDEFAYRLDNSSVRKVLEGARDKNCEIMVFVGNRGSIQIHTGDVQKLVDYGEFYNVLDPKFNLHIKESEIDSIWVTRKPTEDGIVTGVEIYDKANELICTFFGKRKPGIPELELWREIVSTLPKI